MYERRFYLEIDTTIPGWSRTLLTLQKTFAGRDCLWSGGGILTTTDGRLTWLTMEADDALSVRIAETLAPYVVNKLSYPQMRTRYARLMSDGRFTAPEFEHRESLVTTSFVSRHKWKLATGAAAAAAAGATALWYFS